MGDTAMKKMDEMDRNIQLRSKEWGYRTAYNPLPGLILCVAVCIQGFSQSVIKRRMIAGDEEYREPNRLLWGIIGAVIVAVAVASAGTYFIMRV